MNMFNRSRKLDINSHSSQINSQRGECLNLDNPRLI